VVLKAKKEAKRLLTVVVLGCLISSSTVMAFSTSNIGGFVFALSPGGQTLAMPQFDDFGGTLELTSVSLDLAGTVQARIEAENDSEIAGNMGVSLVGFLEAGGPSLLYTSSNISNSGGPVAVTPTIAPIRSGTDYYDFGIISDTGLDSDIISSGLSPYIGTGTVNIDISGTAGFSVSGVTDSTMWVQGLGANGTATVTYEYIKVPEPTTLSILALGVLALVRRKSRI
jgi:hypothetical protein